MSEEIPSRPKKVSGRAEALSEQFKRMAEEAYKSASPVKQEESKDQLLYTKKHMDLLEQPDVLEIMVRYADSLVKDVQDVWTAVFLSQASCYAPPIAQGEKLHRAQAHILIVGEYSTAKSSMYKLILRMCPKAMMPSDFSPVALMGSVRRDGLRVRGLAEEADRCIMVIDEFDKILGRSPTLDGLLRTYMEEQRFYRKTGYGTLSYNTHPVIIAGANPTNDVFRDELMLKQIPFKYGLLSRFDYMRPLAYNVERINELAEFMARTCFKTAKIEELALSVDDIRKIYYAIQASYCQKNVQTVETDKSLLLEMSEKFVTLQKNVNGVPLLSVRDFMSGMRFFNASAILHLRQREVKDGALIATRQDLEYALNIMETTAKTREILLTSVSRKDVELRKTPFDNATEIVIAEIQRNAGSCLKTIAVEALILSMGFGRTAAYKYVDQMVANKSVVQKGLREATLQLPE